MNNDEILQNLPVNRLSKLDMNEPEHLPLKFAKAFKRSVYFPGDRGRLLYEAVQVGSKTKGLGINDIVAEALELWIRNNWTSYVTKLHNEALSVAEKNTEALDCLKAIEKELQNCHKSDERFKQLFNVLMDSVAEFCPDELHDAADKALDHETYEEISSEIDRQQYGETEEDNPEAFEYGERVKSYNEWEKRKKQK